MIAGVGRLIKSVFVGFLALFKRALCFLNRKRRDSGSILPTHIQQSTLDMPTQVLSNNFQIPTLPVDHLDTNYKPADPIAEFEVEPEEVFTDWDNWDKPPATQLPQEPKPTQEPKLPTRHGSKLSQEAEPEPEPDYFSDLGLAPTIQKQKKTLIKPAIGSYNHQPAPQSNRLAFAPDLAAPISAELEEWDDSTGAWEDEDLTTEAEQALRQARKAERERRLAEHQKRNQNREHRKLSKDDNRLATKIS